MKKSLVFRRNMAGLAQQLERDQQSISNALENDRQNLQEKLHLAQLNGQQLNELLLDGEMRRWWGQLKPWLELAQLLTESPESNELGNRGRFVEFETKATEPSYLIRIAHLDGQLELAGHEIAFLGEASDLTLPGRHGVAQLDRPTRMKLVTQGPFTAQLFTQLDQIAGTPRQQLALRCDDLPVPGRTWGDEDSLSVAVAPSRVQVQARLVAHDGQIEGKVRVTQRDIELRVRGTDRAVPEMLIEPLHDSVAAIEQLDLWVDLSGSIAAPECRLRSDLGTNCRDGWTRWVGNSPSTRQSG